MKQTVLRLLLPAGLLLGLLVWFLGSISGIDAGQAQEGKRQLEDALRRGAVACYAAEGSYPPTLEYLTRQYGIQIDEARYAVFYEVFAENLMPDITVLEKEP